MASEHLSASMCPSLWLCRVSDAARFTPNFSLLSPMDRHSHPARTHKAEGATGGREVEEDLTERSQGPTNAARQKGKFKRVSDTDAAIRNGHSRREKNVGKIMRERGKKRGRSRRAVKADENSLKGHSEASYYSL